MLHTEKSYEDSAKDAYEQFRAWVGLHCPVGEKPWEELPLLVRQGWRIAFDKIRKHTEDAVAEDRHWKDRVIPLTYGAMVGCCVGGLGCSLLGLEAALPLFCIPGAGLGVCAAAYLCYGPMTNWPHVWDWSFCDDVDIQL